MYNGDKARKTVLVDYGFRLPSCLDNRPLKFNEFEQLIGQVVFASATPGPYELEKNNKVVEQIIRPTGLVDPEIIVIPAEHQVDDLIEKAKQVAVRNQRILVTTLTKRMAEDLAHYLEQAGLATKYIHSELDTIERVRILTELRKKDFDCLVGVNLLREGLDLPEVSLVCVMDADKEGFLRSQTALIQVAGRAARNIDGKVIMYANQMTRSLANTIKETARRRKKQLEYNKQNNITPRSVQKAIKDLIEVEEEAESFVREVVCDNIKEYERLDKIDLIERQMESAAKNLQFEKAIILRDKLRKLKADIKDGHQGSKTFKRKQK
jgi:excinuclease ABC subunit B